MNGEKLRRALSLAAVTGVLATSAYVAVPAWAAGDDSATPAGGPDASAAASPVAAQAGSPSTPEDSAGTSAAGLAGAVHRDLGLTPEQFSDAGELGVRAEAAATRLRDVSGYTGIRLADNRIIVTGSGAELQAAVDALAASTPGLPVELEAAAALESAAPGSPAPGSQLAASTEQLFQAYVRDVGITGLQGVVSTGAKFVIKTGGVNAPESAGAAAPSATLPGATTGAGAGKMSPAEFVSRYANVQLAQGAPLKPQADVRGGVGYAADSGWVCSTGFSAFTPDGLPAVLTAGHCGEDGASKTADLLLQGVRTDLLGSFQFSQFGGPGNAPVLRPNNGTDPGNVGTDLSVIGALRADLDPLPAATTWGHKSALGEDVKIIGATAPVIGMDVCRSGWRTGWSCGTINEVGIYLIEGTNYAADRTDLRAIRGFVSLDVQSSGGDSGGPWISGNFAVGIHSAGESGGAQNFALAATLQDALEVLPGYQLEVFLNKPVLTSPVAGETVKAGHSIFGRVPAEPASAAGSAVRITLPGHEPFDVPVDSAGNWSFDAPWPAGPLTFQAETMNGLSRSGTASLTVDVAPAPLDAPTITTPADQPLTQLTTLSGTGAPGAAVTLSGDVAGSGTVGLDGQWTVNLTGPAAFGKVTANAVLSSPGTANSPAATATVQVTPPDPVIASINDGQHLRQDNLPQTISGSGIEGAEVAVSIDGKPLSSPVAGSPAGSRSAAPALVPLELVAGGTWSVPFPDGLVLGVHTVSVTQTLDGLVSAPAVASFVLDPPPPPAPADPATHVPPASAGSPPAVVVLPPASAPADLANTSGNAGSRGGLANTGASALVPAASAAAAAIVAGGVLMVLVRRRRRQTPK
ncbi:trypsin [Arthrobacter sp. SLBN-100]|uniref:S1 family peptidase n=1 Tax=Arthrobacter sp. SLBN-100 TaxID=2768450 RepID=UPI00116A55F6|nr:S1 family peptidase [Arthrobacter sp. SLBN-100]TQJ67846.1 trypsin [Arthrobacter sp. SLBN-100]